MATLQQIRKQIVNVEVNLGGGDPIHTEMVPYSQGQREAQEWVKKLEQQDDDEQATALFYERFFATFKSWDLEDETKPMLDEQGNQIINPRTAKPQYEIIPLTVEGFKAADLDARLLADFWVRAYEAHAAKKAPSGRR